MRAVGIHVFAGGFTRGVREVVDVAAQLEVHDFGGDTVRAMGVPFINAPRWEDWPRIDAEFAFGNPRCTGFSCITSGYGEEAHGPWSGPTRDIHDLCQYAVRAGIDVVIWESVQQAYSVGRELLDYLRDELFAPNGYRIAHVFVNAASFGNCQTRRRYFFVAYRGQRNFNVLPPTLSRWHATVRDVIGGMAHRKTNSARLSKPGAKYGPDTCHQLNDRELRILPHLEPNASLNSFAREHEDALERLCPKYYDTWVHRCSEKPFSLHCIKRVRWDWHCPTLHSSCSRLIHPELDRPLTVGELAAVMGWGGAIPSGNKPVHQIAKGVVPAVGRWLAEQVRLYLDNAWGRDDWSTRYDHVRGEWRGERYTGRPIEKVLDMTHYYPPLQVKEAGDGLQQR